jgi:transaldolase
MISANSGLASDIKAIAWEGIEMGKDRIKSKSSSFWLNLKKTGTELWLDTGDIESASEIWTSEMSGLTTNNTLLNMEIQKGIYDNFIDKTNHFLKNLDLQSRIMEISFILNARHGLRLVSIFGGKVSVELHTDLAHNIDGMVEYGLRFHDIHPDNFLIKVPYTAAGIIGAKKLRELGVPVNFTLEFSARQNALVAAITRPNYQNVFLGRVGAYFKSNELGDGSYVGEKATLGSLRIIRELTGTDSNKTRLIAASLRSADQLPLLAGVNVFTMPVNVAKSASEELDGNFYSRINEDYSISLFDNISPEGLYINKLWEVSENELKLAKEMGKSTPRTGKELIKLTKEAGCNDLFPDLSDDDLKSISDDGKIPLHQRWADRIAKGELAIDTLLNLAGLASFTTDQAQLDRRIKSVIEGIAP